MSIEAITSYYEISDCNSYFRLVPLLYLVNADMNKPGSRDAVTSGIKF